MYTTLRSDYTHVSTQCKKKRKQLSFPANFTLTWTYHLTSAGQLAERTYFANKKQVFAMGGVGEV